MLNEIFRYIIKREAYRGYRGVLSNPIKYGVALLVITTYLFVMTGVGIISWNLSDFVGPFSTIPIWFFIMSFAYFIKAKFSKGNDEILNKEVKQTIIFMTISLALIAYIFFKQQLK